MKSFFHRLLRPGFFRKYLVFAIMVPLGYLTHVCVMPYLEFGGVTPNLLYVIIGIVTVAYGRLQTFWVGLFYGLLMEIMLPSVPFFNLALYPITSLFTSFVFADKSQRALEMDRAMRKEPKEMHPLLRTVLCTMVSTLAFEIFNVAYIYLGGTGLLLSHFQRAALDVFLTGLMALALAVPIRLAILGRRREVPKLKNQPIVFSRK